jgi:hypothetical protein
MDILSLLIVILILVFIIVFQQLKINKQNKTHDKLLKDRNHLKKMMSTVSRMEAYGLQKAIDLLKTKRERMIASAQSLKQELKKELNLIEMKQKSLLSDINSRELEIIQLDEEILLQSFGFYKMRYDLASSTLYKARLDKLRKSQAAMIKQEKAVYGTISMTMNNSEAEGRKLVKDYVKLILRSFNNECDASISGVKFTNIKSIEKKILKAYETLNNLGSRMSIIISHEYLELKLQELYLCYEYAVKKQEEKEEQQLIRQQMREEAKILKQIEERKAKFEKEEKHFNKARQDLINKLKIAQSEAERQSIIVEKEKIEEKLVEVSNSIEAVHLHEQNTRAGYVYVISNIGSFGDNVYKIGMTRRLDPQERVDELGGTSVPFRFDVHAMIFSEDAPKLENALHQAFDSRRVNMVNKRREFFHVTLDEIEYVVKHNFNKPVEFTLLAEAEQYRESLILRKQFVSKKIDKLAGV